MLGAGSGAGLRQGKAAGRDRYRNRCRDRAAENPVPRDPAWFELTVCSEKERYPRSGTPPAPGTPGEGGGGGFWQRPKQERAPSPPLPRSHHEPSAHSRSMKGTDHKHACACHPERSEGSLCVAAGRDPSQAQDDGLRPSAPFRNSTGGGNMRRRARFSSTLGEAQHHEELFSLPRSGQVHAGSFGPGPRSAAER